MTASADASRRIGARQVLQFIGGFALAGALLGWGCPILPKPPGRRSGPSSGRSRPGSRWFVALVVTGLGAYTFTLTGSMPGLSHLRALIVNVCGSSVSNCCPRRRVGDGGYLHDLPLLGFHPPGGLDIDHRLSRLEHPCSALRCPLIAIVLLTLGRAEMPRIMRDAAVAAVASGAAIVAVFIAVLASGRAATTVGGRGPMLRPLTRRRPRSMSVDALVTDLRARIIDVVRTGWFPMTMGLVGYFAFYYLVFLAIMRTTGVELFHGELFAAFRHRPPTDGRRDHPGGVGVTETGTAAALVAWGRAGRSDGGRGALLDLHHLLEVPMARRLAGLVDDAQTPAPDDEPALACPGGDRLLPVVEDPARAQSLLARSAHGRLSAHEAATWRVRASSAKVSSNSPA